MFGEQEKRYLQYLSALYKQQHSKVKLECRETLKREEEEEKRLPKREKEEPKRMTEERKVEIRIKKKIGYNYRR